MLHYQFSRFFKTRERAVLAGTSFVEEGICVALTRQGGELTASPSTGDANEVFGGFSISVNVPATVGTQVSEFIIPVSGVVNLARLPVVGQLFVSVEGDKFESAIGTSAPAAAGSVVQEGSKLYFHADDAGKTGYYQYHYELSASEAAQVTGDYYGGNLNTATVKMNSVGCVVEGEIATNMFDASQDWSTIINPRMGADGRLTTTGSGKLLTSVKVVSAPSSDVPYLVLEVSGE